MIPYDLVSQAPLFRGIAPETLLALLSSLEARTAVYRPEQVIFHSGDTVSSLGLILSGSVRVERFDLFGTCNILASIAPGQVFGESYACLPQEPLEVRVVAAETCEILFLDWNRMLAVSTPENRLVQNLLTIFAGKNLALTRKMRHITPRSIRSRLLSYLSHEAVRQGKHSFEIPFNRQQLADYLAVDRSALSAELSKMQKEGLIVYRKNWFQVGNV